MLEKKIIGGKSYTPITNLQRWDRNPRYIEEADLFRLKKQLANLGQYKPSLVTEHGIVIGGNMRQEAMTWLNENVLEYQDKNGNTITLDRRGQFNDVWITELSFAQEEGTGVEGNPAKWRVLIDGKMQEKMYDSQEQAMLEYALSDNDTAGRYDTNALAELLTPHKEEIYLPDYKLELGYPVNAQNFLDDFLSDTNKKLPEDDKKDDNYLDNKKSVFVAEFTPSDFVDVKSRVEALREYFNTENNTEFFLKLLDTAEGVMEREENTGERILNAQDTVAASTEQVPSPEEQQT